MEVGEGQSAVTVHHRPVGCDQHELPCQDETEGIQCPCHHSWQKVFVDVTEKN